MPERHSCHEHCNRHTTERLIAELYKIDGKAEIVGGRIVMMSPTGDMPGDAAGRNLRTVCEQHARQLGGRAYADNVAFLVDLPNRTIILSRRMRITPVRGPEMKFLPQAPDFAAEVRSEGDYGPAAEHEMAAKRADYFAAGTKVVWDVDLAERGRSYGSIRPLPRHADHISPRRAGRSRAGGAGLDVSRR